MDINIINEIKEVNCLICDELYKLNKDNILSKHPSPLQIAIAFYLDNNKDRDVYQKDLQEEFHISKAAISDVVNSMEKKNILERIPSSIDGRKNRIILTDFGMECFKDIKNNRLMFNEYLINLLDEEEINLFIGIINKIKNNIERDDIS